MFTSRAEYRLLLREDNADLRLTPVGRELGIVDDRRWASFENKREAVHEEQKRLDGILLRPARLQKNDVEIIGGALPKECRAGELLRRPELSYRDIISITPVGESRRIAEFSGEQREQVELQLEVQAKYAGYIERQQREIDRHAKQESLRLPGDIDYGSVQGLSNEAKQRLESSRPETLGHASRLEGVTPSTVSLLLIHLKKAQLQKSA
jgi:tRNA uridine 5-carboxymethylaminomethyl modification enzyme